MATQVKQATLYDPAGKASPVIVDVGSSQASDLQSKGWTLTKVGSPAQPGKMPVAKTTPTDQPTVTNTIKGYDVNQGGKEVYVAAGYNKGISATPINSVDEANKLINKNQQADQSSASMGDQPGVKKSLADYKKEVTTNIGDVKEPAAPNYEKAYTDLKVQYGVDTLESQLNDLKKAEQDLRANERARKQYEADKPVAMGVISGKQSEIDRQAQEQIDANLREQDYLGNQLKTKYDVISNVMNLKKADYETAKAHYDQEYTQTINLMNYMKADQTAQQSIEDKKADNARADATIIYNAIANNAATLASVTPAQKATLNKLEVQAGLPIGFFESLHAKLPQQTIKTVTTANNTSGGQSTYILSTDQKTGAPKITEMPLANSVNSKAKAGATGTGTATKKTTTTSKTSQEAKDIAKFQSDASSMIQKLDAGKISWGTAYDSLKTKYPKAKPALIDKTLGGGFDQTTKQWWGRAAK